MEQQLQEDIRLKEGQRIVSMDSAAYGSEDAGSYGFASLVLFPDSAVYVLFIYIF